MSGCFEVIYSKIDQKGSITHARGEGTKNKMNKGDMVVVICW